MKTPKASQSKKTAKIGPPHKRKHPCGSCGRFVVSIKDARTHPELGTLQCVPCHTSHKLTGDLSKCRGGVDLKGQDEYCRWCLDGGELVLCYDNACRFGFCQVCIGRNIGGQSLDAIKNTEFWYCFICDPSQLKKQRLLTEKALKRLTSETIPISDLQEKPTKTPLEDAPELLTDEPIDPPAEEYNEIPTEYPSESHRDEPADPPRQELPETTTQDTSDSVTDELADPRTEELTETSLEENLESPTEEALNPSPEKLNKTSTEDGPETESEEPVDPPGEELIETSSEKNPESPTKEPIDPSTEELNKTSTEDGPQSPSEEPSALPEELNKTSTEDGPQSPSEEPSALPEELNKTSTEDGPQSPSEEPSELPEELNKTSTEDGPQSPSEEPSELPEELNKTSTEDGPQSPSEEPIIALPEEPIPDVQLYNPKMTNLTAPARKSRVLNDRFGFTCKLPISAGRVSAQEKKDEVTPTKNTTAPMSLEDELYLSDDSDQTMDICDEDYAEQDNSSEQDVMIKWMLRDGELLQKRLREHIDTMSKCAETFNANRFKMKPQEMISWANNLQTFINITPNLGKRCKLLVNALEMQID